MKPRRKTGALAALLTAVAAHTAIITESVKFSARPTNCFAAPYQVDLLVTDTALDGAADRVVGVGEGSR